VEAADNAVALAVPGAMAPGARRPAVMASRPPGPASSGASGGLCRATAAPALALRREWRGASDMTGPAGTYTTALPARAEQR